MTGIPLETPNFNEDDPSREADRVLKNRIATAIYTRSISDDNPSEENGYTALSQLILYEFGQRENIFESGYIKEEVLELAREMVYKEQEVSLDVRSYDEKVISVRIARCILDGVITDDTVSQWARLTSLEQIIYYECGPIDDKKLGEMKKKIKAAQAYLCGGSKLPTYHDYNEYYISDEY